MRIPTFAIPSSKRFRLWAVLVASGVLVLSVAVVTIVPLVIAVREVAHDTGDVEAEVRSVDLAGAKSGIARLADSSGRLAERSGALPWSVLAKVPLVGPNLAALNVAASSLASIAGATAPLLDRATSGSSSAERVLAMANSSDDLAALAQALETASRNLEVIEPGALNFGLGDKIAALQQQLPDITRQAVSASEAASHLPAMVGVGKPRTWLVMLQNPAEARGTGGLFSAYALIQVQDGAWRILEASSRKDALDEVDIPYEKVLAERPSTLWDDNLRHWASFNLSVDFPLNAELAAAGMAARGTPIDGVIAIDPAVIAALLAGTGPVEHQGVTIDSASAESFFLRDIYARFADFPDVPAKDRLTMGLLFATVSALQDRPLDLASLVSGIQPAIEHGHLKVWSADPAEERWLATTSVGGEVPAGPGPIVAVALNNASGGKIDAYLDTQIDYSIDSCSPAGDGLEDASVTVTLTNRAPDGLPEYVDFRLDDPSGPAGSTSMIVTVLGPVGSQDIQVDLDGAPTPFAIRSERGKPAWSSYVAIGQGDSPIMAFRFRQAAAGARKPLLVVQSMANEPLARVRSSC
jgi:hypothetical protein